MPCRLSVVVALFVLPAVSVVLPSATLGDVERPNIVFIMADDLGIGHVGCYGQEKIRTPHIDRLAAEGMRFTDFYCGANVCAPSRSVLMTGLHTGHTPVRNNGLFRYLYAEDVTVAEVLKSAGYATGGFGKWGLGEETTTGCAVDQGFDEWFGQYNQKHAHFYYPYFLWHGKQRFPLAENEGRRRERYAHDEIHAKALDFIRRHKDQPFFCYLPYILPHVELTVPADSLAEYAGKFPKIARDDPRPGYLGSEDAYAEFAGMVSRLDRHVGEVVGLVDQLGLKERTIIFFCSDNGPQGGAWTDIFVEYFDGNGPYRGAKGNFYEGGIRTAMIARWPGRVEAGSTSDHVGAFYDVLPTLAELGGAELTTATDGLSLVPTLLDRGEQRRHEFLYWEQPLGAAGLVTAVRMGDWKAIRPKPGGAWELYDLAGDPGETKDVAAEHPDLVARIEQIARQEHTPERAYQADPRGLEVSDFVR